MSKAVTDTGAVVRGRRVSASGAKHPRGGESRDRPSFDIAAKLHGNTGADAGRHDRGRPLEVNA
jgi:hypothetical protein